MFQTGQQIGSYTLIRELGKGGFGEVWLAEKRSQFVTKKVAVKLPLDEQVDFEAIQKEAELWEQASGHANVLPIIDADVIDGQVVIVSEYADGGSLADKLKRDGKLTIGKAVEMTIGILNGLEFLHNRGIIHRDIKPANILLQGDNPRLADFGISRAMQTSSISSTIIGTDSYMSPESFRGLRTVQTDIWSVGVVLYQLLNGRLPFPKENPSEKMYSILQEEFMPLAKDIPPELQQIIKKALAKLSENRFQTTSQMRENLQLFLSSLSSPINTQVQSTNVLSAPTTTPNSVVSIPDGGTTVVTVVRPTIVPSRNRIKIKESTNKKSTESQDFFKGLRMVVLFVLFSVFLIGFAMFAGSLVNPEKAIKGNTTNKNINSTLDEQQLIVKFTSSFAGPVMTSIIDGRSDGSYEFRANDSKVYNPKQSLRIMFSKQDVSFLRMTINEKPIALPTKPFVGDGVGIVFEINKNKVERILKAGAITPESVGFDNKLLIYK